MKQNLIKLYYLIIFVALISQSVITVYNLSRTMGFGTRMNLLEKEKQQLEEQHRQLEVAIANESALTNPTLARLKVRYTKNIEYPLVVTLPKTVASR